MSSAPSRTRVWRPDWPCPVGTILSTHRRGPGDPTFRVEDGRVHRGIRTPAGPVRLLVEAWPAGGEVRAEAWGPGAEWVLDALPDLLGARDDATGFDPRHPVLREAWRRHHDVRLGRTGLVMEALVPAVLEQRVTGQEAFAGFRRLVRRYGEPAPGPGPRLWVQPTPEALRTVPSWEWLRMHVDPARSRAVVTAARVAPSLERLASGTGEEMETALCSLPGIGVWTAAEVRQRALGDADAVSFGDYHVAKDVGWALTGAPFDDAELASYLEPWRPHRGRVPMLVGLAGLFRPRRGPRMAPRTHLPATR